jgi:large subunit ribosomal protein L9
MEVILLERIERLGQMGDVVKVKPGFARNYLLPQRKALRATPENRAYFDAQRHHLEAQNLTRRSEAEQVAAKLNGLSVVLVRQAGESGQLYGSVTTRDVADALEAAGFSTERRQIHLPTPIKALGIYNLKVSLHPEVAVTIAVNVAKTEEEAEAQAAANAAELLEPVTEEPKAAKKRKKKSEGEEAEGQAAEGEAGAAAEGAESGE